MRWRRACRPRDARNGGLRRGVGAGAGGGLPPRRSPGRWLLPRRRAVVAFRRGGRRCGGAACAFSRAARGYVPHRPPRVLTLPRSLWHGRQVLALSTHLLSCASMPSAAASADGAHAAETEQKPGLRRTVASDPRAVVMRAAGRRGLHRRGPKRLVTSRGTELSAEPRRPQPGAALFRLAACALGKVRNGSNGTRPQMTHALPAPGVRRAPIMVRDIRGACRSARRDGRLRGGAPAPTRGT